MKWICKKCGETFNETPACIYCHSINCEPFDNTTKIYNEFTEELNFLINKFHKEHQDLFVNEINIKFVENASGYKTFSGVKVEIFVQPSA